MLEMRLFKILCDNQAVVKSLTKKNGENFSAQVLLHFQFISQYSTECDYIASDQNSVADALTRTGIAQIHDLNLPLDFESCLMLNQAILRFKPCAKEFLHYKSKVFLLKTPTR